MLRYYIVYTNMYGTAVSGHGRASLKGAPSIRWVTLCSVHSINSSQHRLPVKTFESLHFLLSLCLPISPLLFQNTDYDSQAVFPKSFSAFVSIMWANICPHKKQLEGIRLESAQLFRFSSCS